MRTFFRQAVLIAAVIGFAFTGVAVTVAQQHASDPAMQKAREETQVVLDFARFLGIVLRMVEQEPTLGLSSAQARQLLDVLSDVRTTSRLTATNARRMMGYIEDDILTAQQLMFTDRVWMQSSGERSSAGASGSQNRGSNTTGEQSGTGSEASANAGALSSYASGGPYNPLSDTTRRQGQDFEALYEYALSRAGR
ncbi:MAG: hypothetical protein EA426_03060 [Spirochaetaceae bacterium]|nr:MAG: hypothetical protein EA426_03060 [Spirochaetaceae bacterium]